ncbi:MAG: nucleoside 2-deoxyribosyltransferase [Pseudorhodoplanes sp.]|nr:nucleoside 2-deoxyribosyltransferase [Pseudorhodoplanes sp.]
MVGEVFVDFTVTAPGGENKLRLGGITHAARGFWALNVPFRVAAILPDYLEKSTRRYFNALGCIDFRTVGHVSGAPNVTVLFDQIELADQQYETLLRDEKSVEVLPENLSNFACKDVLIFPGSYDLRAICTALPQTAQIHIDVAYDVDNPGILEAIPQQIQTILISTSSPLFKAVANSGLDALIEAFKARAAATLILKENRGGARMAIAGKGSVDALPAQLGTTTNSVGVGDVFAATYVAHCNRERVEAAWRATFAAAAYSQTTDPNLFKTYINRDLRLSLDEMQQLGGVFLPWEKRRKYAIYLAAPDFSHADRRAIDKALASLSYHNFDVRRPVIENHELPPAAPPAMLQNTYRSDYELLKRCALVFAVPTGRDPGTLVEIGIAIEADIPVVVYDPEGENANTMVMAGADFYSIDLDQCLNNVFRILSEAVDQ